MFRDIEILEVGEGVLIGKVLLNCFFYENFEVFKEVIGVCRIS